MTKHNVFISYHHDNDEQQKREFIMNYGGLFIDNSVHPGEYDDSLSDKYIKRLIMEEKITDSTVLIVLVGEETYSRKHVDWEISAALNKKAGGYSGLLGIILPPIGAPRAIPARLWDNIQSEYAIWCYLPEIMLGQRNLGLLIDEAFERKNSMAAYIKNGRPQMSENSHSEKHFLKDRRIRF